MVKRNSIVYLMGGLGNQIFQLSLANRLRNEGHNIKIDISNYSFPSDDVIQKRELVFPLSYFGFEPTKNEMLKYKIFSKIRKNSFKNYKFFPFKKFNDKNFQNALIGKHNLFVGYWQDVDLIKENTSFLKESLSNEKLIFDSLKRQKSTNNVMVHVRRKDYLEMKEELSINYYKNAINIANKKIINCQFDVFTDDFEWVKKQKLFNNAKNIIYSNNSVENTIKDFSRMLSYKHFIISNSTYSLIPAIINEESDSLIIMPEPWFKNENKNINPNKSWIKLNNE
tara:strand:- start:566 stop:1411 length:846 start_codon:yes stop_codon:yes gene_type:complete